MKKHRKPKENKNKFYAKGVLVLVLAILFFAYFLGGEKASPEAAKKLPDYAKASRSIALAYAYAYENPEILEKIPCYCGCYAPVAMHGGFEHKNNKNCFLKDDGSWVKHGSECDVCIYIALDVKNWLKEGMGIKQVRDGIDSKYRRNGAPPTRTPPLDENGNFIVG